MRFALASATIATLATAVLATNWPVDVGLNGLNFTPPTINVQPGDTVEFTFHPKNHSATQSSFASPCVSKLGGSDTGFQPVSANATVSPNVTITVNDTNPLWFYCMQANHCEQGMVFSINPTANETFAAFLAAAKAWPINGTTPASNASGSGTGSGSSPLSGTGSGSAATSSPTSSSFNGAVTVGARAGGILAVVGFAASVLL